MTAPNFSTRRRDDQETFTEWFMLHKRGITWAAVAIVVIAGGIWFYERSQTLKAQHAEAALYQARQAAASGNLAKATSDLQKVVTRYEGTQGGAQASLALAQILYDQKKFKEGVDALKKAEDQVPDDFKASVHILEAAGYEELKNFDAAAQQYEEAAKVTRFPADKAEYQADAARNYTSAGKLDRAREIWTALAKDETNPLAAEAKVRLGELEAKPMAT
jgi:predicted negative regulator of RcsB-dependent stress response